MRLFLHRLLGAMGILGTAEVVQFPDRCVQGHRRWIIHGIIGRDWSFGFVRKER